MPLAALEAPIHVMLALSRATEAGDPFAFRIEPQKYTVHTLGGGAGSAHLAWGPDLLQDLAALRDPNPDAGVIQRVGETLRTFLHPAGWGGWALREAEIEDAVEHGKPVVVTLRFAAAELYALPWELCTLGATGRRLGELPGVLLRYEWPETSTAAEQPSPRPEGGRILVAWSAAGGVVPHADHVRVIGDAARLGFRPFDPERDVLPHASYGRLRDALEATAPKDEPIAAVHLLCHGGSAGQTFGLWLDGEEGGRVLVDAGRLRELFAAHAARVRLVVVAACDGGNAGSAGNALGSVAQAIHRGGVAAVVAARFPLSVAGSTRLCEALYGKLFVDPSSLEHAFLAARSALARDAARFDGAALTLHARDADGDDSRPFVVRPYRGLLAFQTEHRRLFFGRDDEIAELLSDLDALVKAGKPRFMVVAGASGTGKSSMVLAGAIPRLLERPGPRWEVGYLRPGRDPLSALDEVLGRRSDPVRPMLIVVDQLEELFTQTTQEAARQGFVRRLWSLSAETGSGIHVVLTLRVDFIGRCGELAFDDGDLRLDRVAYDEAHRVFVAQMKRGQLAAAITGPADRVGLKLAPGLLERLLDETGGEPGALPLLEDTLDMLWQRREGRLLTQTAYDALHGVAGALHGRADALIDALDHADRRIARRLLVRLVGLRGDETLATRRRVLIEELRPPEDAEAERFDRVLATLVDERLLVRGEEGGKPAVEVAHEALIRRWARLGTWVEEDRDKILQLDKIAGWVGEWKARGALLRGGQLAYAEEAEKRWAEDLGADAKKLLAESRAKAAQERRNRWLAVMGLALALLAAWMQNRALKKSERIAKGRLASALAEPVGRRMEALVLGINTFAGTTPANVPAAVVEGMVHGLMPVRELGVLEGHTDSARAVVFSPDGTRVVTASSDNTARLWDAKDGKTLATLQGHTKSVRAAAFSPDGTRVVTASEDNTARLWDAKDGSPLATLQGHTSSVLSVAFSPDGTRVVTASSDNTARLWDAKDGKTLATLQGHTNIVMAVAFSPDGTRIVTASWDHTARLWDAKDGKTLATLQGHTNGVEAVAFSPDGTRIVTVSLDNTARLWDARDGKTLATLLGHTRSVEAVAFSPDGACVATASMDNTARLWDAKDGKTLATLLGHTQSVRAVAFSSDGARIVTASSDNTARLWDAEDGKTLATLQGHTNIVWAVAFSPDGTRIVTASEDKTAWLWDAKDGKTLATLQGHRKTVWAVAFSPDGTRVVTASSDNTARLWDAKNGSPLATLQGHTSSVLSVAFSPDGARIVTASMDNTARLWDAKDGKILATLQGHRQTVRAVAFSPDGTRVVTVSDSYTAQLWDAKDGKTLTTLLGHTRSVKAAAFSPDGTRVATVSEDKTARLWDAKDGKTLATLQGHTKGVWAVAFSPDGTRVATVSEDKTARLWDAKDGKALATLQGHTKGVWTVAFSPDGTRVVTASGDNTARLWDAKDGKTLATLQGHTKSVWAVAFSPDGTRVVTASGDNTVRLWDAQTGELLASLPHLRAVTSCAFSPDGRHLATASADGMARIWAATPEGFLIQACQFLRPWPAYYSQVAETCAPWVDKVP